MVNVFDAVDDIEDDDLGGLFTEEGSNNGDRPAIEWGMKGGSVINSPRTLIASSAPQPQNILGFHL